MFNPSVPSPENAPRLESLGPHFKKIFFDGKWEPIHLLIAPDTGPPHDHAYSMKCTKIVSRGYREDVWVLTTGGGYTQHRNVERRPGTMHDIDAETIHLITALLDGEGPSVSEPEPGRDEGRIWYHYLPQEDGSVLRSRNWDGPWEDFHPAGPVYQIDYANPQEQGIARLAPVAEAFAHQPRQTTHWHTEEEMTNDFVIGAGNSWKEALAAMFNGYAVTQHHWKGYKWVIENNTRQIMLVTGTTKEEWAASAEPIKEIPDMEVIGRVWIVLPKIHPEPPTI